MVTAATATLSTTSSSWQVNISFNGAGTTAFGNLTTSMFDSYGNNGNPTSPLDQLAVVLDGNIVSSPNVISLEYRRADHDHRQLQRAAGHLAGQPAELRGTCR